MKRSEYGMPPPRSRREMEHNINLLLEDIERAFDTNDEEFIRNKCWASLPHIKKLKYLPNQRIHINTINEQLRLQANMLDWIKYIDPLQNNEN